MKVYHKNILLLTSNMSVSHLSPVEPINLFCALGFKDSTKESYPNY